MTVYCIALAPHSTVPHRIFALSETVCSPARTQLLLVVCYSKSERFSQLSFHLVASRLVSVQNSVIRSLNTERLAANLSFAAARRQSIIRISQNTRRTQRVRPSVFTSESYRLSRTAAAVQQRVALIRNSKAHALTHSFHPGHALGLATRRTTRRFGTSVQVVRCRAVRCISVQSVSPPFCGWKSARNEWTAIGAAGTA